MDRASLPVTQEIVGSNPIEVAWKMARYANRQSGATKLRRCPNLRDCGFDSRPRHFRVVLLTAACKAVVVKEVTVDDERFNSFTTHLWPVRLSVQDASPSRWRDHAAVPGSIPARAAEWPSGATGRRATLRTSCPQGLGSSTLPMVTETLQARQVPNWLRAPMPALVVRLVC